MNETTKELIKLNKQISNNNSLTNAIILGVMIALLIASSTLITLGTFDLYKENLIFKDKVFSYENRNIEYIYQCGTKANDYWGMCDYHNLRFNISGAYCLDNNQTVQLCENEYNIVSERGIKNPIT